MLESGNPRINSHEMLKFNIVILGISDHTHYFSGIITVANNLRIWVAPKVALNNE